MDQATDSLARWRSNIHLISQLIQNDVSSTKVLSRLSSTRYAAYIFFFKVRLFLRRGLSVRYLLPNSVVDYIEQNGLYQDETTSLPPGNSPDKGKGREKETTVGGSKKDI
jgi:nicotinamide mononucleotide adenylyltransferase